MTSTYVAHNSPVRMMILLALLAAMGAILVLVDFSPLLSGRTDGRISRLDGAIMALPWLGGLAILLALAFVPTLFRKRVEIEVSAQGITYPSALKEVLPWERIDRVAVRKMSVYKVLAVTIRDADSFPIKPLARKAAKLNKVSGDYGDINIETIKNTGDFDELIAVVGQYVTVEPLP